MPDYSAFFQDYHAMDREDAMRLFELAEEIREEEGE